MHDHDPSSTASDADRAAPDTRFDRRDAFGLIAALAALGGAGEAAAQDVTLVNPRIYRTVFENPKVRAVAYTSQPGIGVCGVGRHSHPAHLTVALTAVKAKVTLADGTVVVADNQPGDVFWEEAVTHTVENVGGAGARVVIVEIKDAAWKPSTGV